MTQFIKYKLKKWTLIYRSLVYINNKSYSALKRFAPDFHRKLLVRTKSKKQLTKNAIWQKYLRDCQQEIVSHSPDYRTTFLPEEYYYWSHLPKWIFEDWHNTHEKLCLDIGCGYGTLLLYTKSITKSEVYGIDILTDRLSKTLIAKHGLNFEVVDIERDPLPWKIDFDIIIFSEVLEHLNYFCVPTLKKIAAQLSDDGRIYLSTPDASEHGRINKYYKSFDSFPMNPSASAPWIDAHTWQFTIDEIIEVVSQAGLNITRLDYAPGVSNRHFNITLSKNS